MVVVPRASNVVVEVVRVGENGNKLLVRQQQQLPRDGGGDGGGPVRCPTLGRVAGVDRVRRGMASASTAIAMVVEVDRHLDWRYQSNHCYCSSCLESILRRPGRDRNAGTVEGKVRWFRW